MTNSHCTTCRIGLLHLNNHYNLKEYKTITRLQFIKQARNLAEKCFPCIYNDQSEKKARKVRKMFPNFKALDMSEPVNFSNLPCPICGHKVVWIVYNGIAYDYCLRDGCSFKNKSEVKNVKQ